MQVTSSTQRESRSHVSYEEMPLTVLVILVCISPYLVVQSVVIISDRISLITREKYIKGPLLRAKS